MCGITGVFTSNNFTEYQSALHQMTDVIVHRGPDAQGHWADPDAGVGLGHRRLSILDLSEAGAQPMFSASGRYVIVFNGELYNHNTLRDELEKIKAAPQWRGHSDTETLLAAVEVWGLEQTLRKSTGMFAIALWDKQDQKLLLARDRAGEKPLYYGIHQGALLFGSELKSIKKSPGFKGEIDKNVLSLYFQYNAVPEPYCIYKGFYKLKPGSILEITHKDIKSNQLPTPVTYWSLAEAATRGLKDPFKGSDAEAVNHLEKLIGESIREQSIADVPLGAFLSGGIDSSTVVAMMQAQSSGTVKTFTIGFDVAAYNEAEHAKKVAAHLGTEHHEMYVTSQQALDVIPKLPHIYCEPFSDSSQVPTFLVSQLAKQHVTVSLSGDAADELFGGYGRYQLSQGMWGKISSVPAPLRKMAYSLIHSLSTSQWDTLLNTVRFALPGDLKNFASGHRAHKFAGLLKLNTIGELYQQLVTHWPGDGIVLDGRPLPVIYTDESMVPEGLDQTASLMFKDILGYMCTDILVKVDRAGMANSLETRVPFLAPNVIEFSQQLPMKYKIRDGQAKWILRQILYKYVPKTIIERPKMGFGIPVKEWLRGPLKEWGEELLNEKTLTEQGLLNVPIIRQRWKEHIDGTRDWAYLLWDVLMFQAWLKENS